jgi:hypothetical protein
LARPKNTYEVYNLLLLNQFALFQKPSAESDGFFIVAVMQFSRLLFVILYIVILIAWLYLQQG